MRNWKISLALAAGALTLLSGSLAQAATIKSSTTGTTTTTVAAGGVTTTLVGMGASHAPVA